jgi:hypothetical protein
VIANAADFVDRYVLCPLCRRDNVRLRLYASDVVLDEHPMGIPVITNKTPIDASARHWPSDSEGKIALVRCPASLAPLLPMPEGAS